MGPEGGNLRVGWIRSRAGASEGRLARTLRNSVRAGGRGSGAASRSAAPPHVAVRSTCRCQARDRAASGRRTPARPSSTLGTAADTER